MLRLLVSLVLYFLHRLAAFDSFLASRPILGQFGQIRPCPWWRAGHPHLALMSWYGVKPPPRGWCSKPSNLWAHLPTPASNWPELARSSLKKCHQCITTTYFHGERALCQALLASIHSCSGWVKGSAGSGACKQLLLIGFHGSQDWPCSAL